MTGLEKYETPPPSRYNRTQKGSCLICCVLMTSCTGRPLVGPGLHQPSVLKHNCNGPPPAVSQHAVATPLREFIWDNAVWQDWPEVTSRSRPLEDLASLVKSIPGEMAIRGLCGCCAWQWRRWWGLCVLASCQRPPCVSLTRGRTACVSVCSLCVCLVLQPAELE